VQAYPTRPRALQKGHWLCQRLTLPILIVCGWWLGGLTGSTPALAQSARLRDFLPQLFAREGVICLDVGCTTIYSPEFFSPELRRLNDSLVPQLVLPPFTSPSTGFIFDEELGVPRRVREPLGPTIGEKATTLGQGHANLALTYSYLEYTRFRGQNLSGFQFSVGIPGVPQERVDVLLNLKITRHVLALSSTLGLTDDLDVGISIPYIFTKLEASATATIQYLGPGPPVARFSPSGGVEKVVSEQQDKEGIGDLRLVGKYVFLRDLEWIGNLGIAGEVKLPTGSAGDLTGTGTIQATGTLVASRDFGWFGPHLNVSFTQDFRDERNQVLKTLFGFDTRILSRLTFASDVVWRYRPHDRSVTNTVDLAAGLRWNPYRQLVVTASAQIPLNKNVGLRTDVTPMLTVEYNF